nr:MAG TPA: hypothetical protein [Caudoviricetes sp.]
MNNESIGLVPILSYLLSVIQKKNDNILFLCN